MYRMPFRKKHNSPHGRCKMPLQYATYPRGCTQMPPIMPCFETKLFFVNVKVSLSLDKIQALPLSGSNHTLSSFSIPLADISDVDMTEIINTWRKCHVDEVNQRAYCHVFIICRDDGNQIADIMLTYTLLFTHHCRFRQTGSDKLPLLPISSYCESLRGDILNVGMVTFFEKVLLL
jgi:hypothetical protein